MGRWDTPNKDNYRAKTILYLSIGFMGGYGMFRLCMDIANWIIRQ